MVYNISIVRNNTNTKNYIMKNEKAEEALLMIVGTIAFVVGGCVAAAIISAISHFIRQIMQNLKSYNTVEINILQGVRDQLKWYLGVELGYDPESTVAGFVEVEMRLAKWLTQEGGGAWMASRPDVSQYK